MAGDGVGQLGARQERHAAALQRQAAADVAADAASTRNGNNRLLPQPWGGGRQHETCIIMHCRISMRKNNA